MARNTLGQHFRISSFGESHGAGVGVLIDGCPAGVVPDMDHIRRMLAYRRPGQSPLSSSREESEEFEILSGLFEGKSTGAPITIFIRNTGQRSSDYDALRDVYRPSHADFSYEKKYGYRDHRGGGRSSARITTGWVAAGALAEQILQNRYGIEILAWVNRIYTLQMPDLMEIDREHIYTSDVRCPHRETALKMEEAIMQARAEGDSLGGSIQCRIRNCPPGIGEPVFGKLHAQLAHAMMSINAAKGIFFGGGFDMTARKGSEVNDAFVMKQDRVGTESNFSGGMQGGISNGEPIEFTVAFKPPASIARGQHTLNRDLQPVDLEIRGRHDPCVLPRAVPIVETLAALVLLDLILENQLQ
jgi:chorismate synthase